MYYFNPLPPQGSKADFKEETNETQKNDETKDDEENKYSEKQEVERPEKNYERDADKYETKSTEDVRFEDFKESKGHGHLAEEKISKFFKYQTEAKENRDSAQAFLEKIAEEQEAKKIPQEILDKQISARDILLRMATDDVIGNTKRQMLLMEKYIEEKIKEIKDNKRAAGKVGNLEEEDFDEIVEVSRRYERSHDEEGETYYEKLDKSEDFKVLEAETDDEEITPVFEYKREFLQREARPCFDKMKDVDDVKELLKWEMKKTTDNRVTLLPRKKREPIVKKVLIDWSEEETKSEESTFEESTVLNVLTTSKNITVFKTSKNQIIPAEENLEIPEPKTSAMVANKISEIRQDIRDFGKRLQAFTESFNKGYANILNKCNEEWEQYLDTVPVLKSKEENKNSTQKNIKKVEGTLVESEKIEKITKKNICAVKECELRRVADNLRGKIKDEELFADGIIAATERMNLEVPKPEDWFEKCIQSQEEFDQEFEESRSDFDGEYENVDMKKEREAEIVRKDGKEDEFKRDDEDEKCELERKMEGLNERSVKESETNKIEETMKAESEENGEENLEKENICSCIQRDIICTLEMQLAKDAY